MNKSMINLLKKYFKFIFTIAWFTWLLISLDSSRTNSDRFLVDEIKYSHRTNEINYEILRDEIHSLKEQIKGEFGFSRALEHVTYEELIKCMNYHAGCLDKKGDDVSRIKKEGHEPELFEVIRNISPAN